MRNILDTTFNLAGACRRGAWGVVLGLVLGGVADYFLISYAPQYDGEPTLVLFLLILILSIIPFAVWGAREEPRIAARTNKYIDGYMKFASAISFASLFTSQPTFLFGKDVVMGERVTVRWFLWHVLFVFTIILLAFVLPSLCIILGITSNDYLIFGSLVVWMVFAYAFLGRLSLMALATVLLASALFVSSMVQPHPAVITFVAPAADTSIATTTASGIPVTLTIDTCNSTDPNFCFGSGQSDPATNGNITVVDTVSKECTYNYGVEIQNGETVDLYEVTFDFINDCDAYESDTSGMYYAEFRDKILDGEIIPADQRFYAGTIDGKKAHLIYWPSGQNPSGNGSYFTGSYEYDGQSAEPMDMALTFEDGGHYVFEGSINGNPVEEFDSQDSVNNTVCDGTEPAELCGMVSSPDGTYMGTFTLKQAPPFSLDTYAKQ